jgi:sugar/nucleoside kinase (ribokinase family)
MDKLKSKLDLKENAVSWFLQKGVSVFVLKMGKQGVMVWTKEKKYSVPPFIISSIDTSGAGDSFAGGLLYGLIQQYDMEQTIRLASACGALTTTIMGPHGVFGLQDVVDIIEKEG